MTPTRWHCAFAETCRFRSDPDLTITREEDRIVMQGSGRCHPTLVCPHRRDCPLRDTADNGLVLFGLDRIEIIPRT